MARTSKITKVLKRIIRTAEYESLAVEVAYEENIEWENLKERQKKSDDITKLLNYDLNRSILASLDELGLADVKAVHKKKGGNVELVVKDEPVSISLDDLDGIE